MPWFNRITRQTEHAPSSSWAPGEWQYAGPGDVAIRAAQARTGDLFMPDASGRCQIEGVRTIPIDPSLVPDADALTTLRTVGDRLLSLEGATWDRWVREPPLVTKLEESLALTPLEEAIERDLALLATVCAQPRTHLQTDEERMIVSRCKRPSTRAPTVLASRSEDWDRRTLWGVRPKRVLGIVQEELFDTYENRIAVALVEHLDRALSDRVRAVGRVVKLLQQGGEYQSLLDDSANYRRAQRVMRLWGEVFERGMLLEHALNVRDRIIALRRRLRGLRSTRLLTELRTGITGRLQLRMTNVFTSDTLYSGVARLWLAWEDHLRSRRLDPDTQWRHEQAAAAGFDRFTFLVVLRALEALSFSRTDAGMREPLSAEGEWDLSGPAGTVTLRRGPLGMAVSSRHASAPLEVVSLPTPLEASVSTNSWRPAVGDRRVLIATLPVDEPRTSRETRLRLRGLASNAPTRGATTVAIAPWDLESVERVARIIRGYVWSALYALYPPRLTVPHDYELPTAIPAWLEHNDDTLAVTTPQPLTSRRWTDLDTQAATLQAQVTVLSQQVASAGKRGRNRLRLQQEHQRSVQQLQYARRVAADLEKCHGIFDKLSICPICMTQADTRAFEVADGQFRFTCGDCGTRWGHQTCKSCAAAFPFIDFRGNTPSPNLLDVDRRLGSDVLALPLSKGVYLCTNCLLPSDGATSDHVPRNALGEPPPTAS